MIHLIADHSLEKSDGMILKSAINQCIDRYHFQSLEDFASQIGWTYNKLINRLENKSTLKWIHRNQILDRIAEVDEEVYQWALQKMTGRKIAVHLMKVGQQLALFIIGLLYVYEI